MLVNYTSPLLQSNFQSCSMNAIIIDPENTFCDIFCLFVVWKRLLNMNQVAKIYFLVSFWWNKHVIYQNLTNLFYFQNMIDSSVEFYPNWGNWGQTSRGPKKTKKQTKKKQACKKSCFFSNSKSKVGISWKITLFSGGPWRNFWGHFR